MASSKAGDQPALPSAADGSESQLPLPRAETSLPTPVRPAPKPSPAASSSSSTMRTFTEAVDALYDTDPELAGDLPFRVKDLRRWITCFCALDFNVEVGPEFECIYPAVHLSEQDLKTICFSSFPEQSYAENTEEFHTFRFKCSTRDLTFPPAANSPKMSRAYTSRYLYGYVLFQQRYDSTKARNYSQKSLTLLSPYEFPALFETCVRKAAQYCFSTALLPTLQTAAGHIAAWPAPEALISRFSWSMQSSGSNGQTKKRHIELAYLGDKIRIQASAADPRVPLGEYSESGIFLFGKSGSWGVLMRMLEDPADIYTVYEHVLLGYSLGVFAPTPSLCSQFVTNAVDLIKPVPYTGLIREYVTMHADLESMNVLSKNPVPGITGFTNPFLSQIVSDCDGAVSLLDICTAEKKLGIKRARGRLNNMPTMNVSFLPILPDLMPSTASTQQMTVDLLYPVTATVEWQRKSFKKLLTGMGISKIPTSMTSTKPKLLVRDRQFIKRVRRMIADSNAATSAAEAKAIQLKIDKFVRLHFANLTAKVMAPVKRFLFVAETSPKNFSYAEFIYYLSQLDGKGGSSISSTTMSGDVLNGMIESTGKAAVKSVHMFSTWGMHHEGRESLSNEVKDEDRSAGDGIETAEQGAADEDEEGKEEPAAQKASAAAKADLQHELYGEAVQPDKEVFAGNEGALQFYTALLRSGNFEAWCFA
ncbi:hypothetical protein BZA70DRAFT_115762 [Myxozyma melibiosi]|uniref:UDENN domain-containing protein n=1 Tax=Myxozyma melibiosi TaxID=54550 RepID=A0ABR1FCR8_9ASCO